MDGSEHVLVGTSAELENIRKFVAKVARTRRPVVIYGESGAGKEVVARMIHAESGRLGKIVALSAAVGTEDLVQSRLFGHVRGAFTHGDRSAVGAFEAAHRGTLFLDEAENMPPLFQSSILQAVEYGRFYPVGGWKELQVDARIIVAARRDLRDLVGAGTFREDLYFRLAVLEVTIPPLREHRDDVLPISLYTLQRNSERYRIPKRSISSGGIRLLREHWWPGNVRELQNVLAQAAVATDQTILDSSAIEEALAAS